MGMLCPLPSVYDSQGLRKVVAQLIHTCILHRNQWSGIFPSRSTNVASDFPLWAVQFDKKPGVSTVTTFMGGWTKAFAKQYYLGEFLGVYKG